MKHLLSLLALAAASGAYAQGLSSDDARQRAAEFFTQQSAAAGPHRAPAKIDPVLAYTIEGDGSPCLYVFNRAADADGFVIINADAAAEVPILGYSESTAFDSENLPDNFRWWLEQYKENGVSKAPAKVNRSNIATLLKTQWNQQEPYNLAIPQLSPTSVRFPTGCTATAMAQVMKFYNYPTHGTGSKEYKIATWILQNGDRVTPTFQADFANTTYDWANMINDYKQGYTSAQANAVATLMYHAGVAEHATYGKKATSADDRQSAIALINHFNYDKSMLRGERGYFTDEEWEEVVYSELAANRPVLYAGSTVQEEGHSFVCDGYKDGLFHINWGWGGLSDGYYALTGSEALTPSHQGTGGADSGGGFSCYQSINYNIQPDHAGSFANQIALKNEFRIGYEKLVTDKVSSATIDRSVSKADKTFYYRVSPYNYGFDDVQLRYGIVLRHKTTGTTYGSSEFGFTLSPSKNAEAYYPVSQTDDTPQRYASFSTSIAKADGVYEVLPAYTTDNGSTWQLMKLMPGTEIPEITIKNTPDVNPDEIVLTDELCFRDCPTVGQDNVVYSPSDLSINATLTNRSAEIVQRLTVLIDCDNGPFQVNYGFGTLKPGFNTSVTFDATVKGQLHFTPGKVYTYQFFLDEKLEQPMNVPSLSFYYATTPTPNATEVTKLIDKAKSGKGNVGLIHSLVNKILQK